MDDAGVFMGCGRPLSSPQQGKMSYEDFIVFFMSEEDKTSEASLRYWFSVCDIDGDGVLTTSGMLHLA
jgi:serine/threonine-protein phosphatase 2A regulatory subunit B''